MCFVRSSFTRGFIRVTCLLLLSRNIYAQPESTPMPAPGQVTGAVTAPAVAASPEPSEGSEEKSGGTLRDLFRTFLPGLDEESDHEETPSTIDSDASDLISPQDLLSEEEIRLARPWQPGDFTGQKEALGWNDSLFNVPPSLAVRVGFWQDVYSKYTSNQGVIHDKIFLNIIYETIDFSAIMSDPNRTTFQKVRLREKLVKERKKAIAERLKQLQGVTNPNSLSGDDLRYWKLFEKVADLNKFKHASEKGRIRFQLGQRDRFIVGIYHSGRYLREMEKVFRDEKLPIELTRLPFVESSFNIRARSRVGASGIWQFMRRTSRHVLVINRDVDERNDPLRATHASARLLKQNFQTLQSWPLAITAYNHGTTGVQRIVNDMKTTDISEIIEGYVSRRFGFASENFYACFLAALLTERNADKIFGHVKWGPALDAQEVKLRQPIAFKILTQFFDGDESAADLANPHILARSRKGHDLIPASTYIRVPSSRAQLAEDFEAGRLNASALSLQLKEKPLLKAALPAPPLIAAPPPVSLPSSTRTLVPAPTPLPVHESLAH